MLYGRRRCGKSRLLLETLRGRRFIYYVGDERDSDLQRRGMATEIARLIPEFDSVHYPDWDAIFDRFWREAPAAPVLFQNHEFPRRVGAAGLQTREVDARVQPPAGVVPLVPHHPERSR